MSAIKAFIEDEAYYFKAGVEAGSESNIFRLADELSNIEDDSERYAVPETVAVMLAEVLYAGWIRGAAVPTHAL